MSIELEILLQNESFCRTPLCFNFLFSWHKVGQYPVGVGMNLKKGLSCDIHTIPASVMKGKGEEYIWDPSPLPALTVTLAPSCWLLICDLCHWHPYYLMAESVSFLLIFRPQSGGWAGDSCYPVPISCSQRGSGLPSHKCNCLWVGSWGLLGPLSFRSYFFPPDCIFFTIKYFNFA